MLGHEAFAREGIRTEREAFGLRRVGHKNIDAVVQDGQDLNLVYFPEWHFGHDYASCPQGLDANAYSTKIVSLDMCISAALICVAPRLAGYRATCMLCSVSRPRFTACRGSYVPLSAIA